MVGILAITFNHEPGKVNSAALNVRKNETTAASIPEWKAGAGANPGDSVAVYSADLAQDRPIRVLVALQQLGAVQPGLQIRAVAAEPDGSGVSGDAPLLGPLAPQVVPFTANGSSQPTLFDVEAHRVREGIAASDIHWRWEFRAESAAAWTPFALTHHRIYVVLCRSSAPWTQQPFTADNDSLLWTDLLEFACKWAAGASTQAAAIGGITRAVNGLGNGLFEYDCSGGGSSHYTTLGANRFECTALLERLQGGLGFGRLINCVDCATIVSSFANALGCDLFQSRMGMHSPFFACNEIVAIGTQVWETPCGFPGFFFHEVAWSGDCTAADQVSDACLLVDGDEDPTAGRRTPLLPIALVFGGAGDGQYRDRIAAPAGRADCEPQPAMRLRRGVSSHAAVELTTVPAHLALPIAGPDRFAAQPAKGSVFFWRFFFTGDELPGWQLASVSRAEAQASSASWPEVAKAGVVGAVTQTMWRHSTRPDSLLHSSVYECFSREATSQVFARIIHEFELPGLEVHQDSQLGDAHALVSRGGAVLFRLGNHVHLLRVASRNKANVFTIAQWLQAHLMATAAVTESRRSVRVMADQPFLVLHLGEAPLPPTRWYRLWSQDGAFHAQRGEIHFQPREKGDHEVQVAGFDGGRPRMNTKFHIVAS
jgi:hypothetical protein